MTWNDLFEPKYIEEYEDLIKDLYKDVTQKFVNVLTRQWIKDVNNKCGTKKRAHCVEVLLSNKKQKLSEPSTVTQKLHQCSDSQLKKLLRSDLQSIVLP